MRRHVPESMYAPVSPFETERSLKRGIMPSAFTRRMRVINVLSAIAYNNLEISLIAPFDEMDIHHVLDKLISQDAIIDILENGSISYALATGNTDQLLELAKTSSDPPYPVLEDMFKTGWIARYFNTPFDPICIVLAARIRKLLDLIDELGHSYNLWNFYWSVDWPEIPIPPIPTPQPPPAPPVVEPTEDPCEHDTIPTISVYFTYTSGTMYLGEEQDLTLAGNADKWHKNNYLWKISAGGGYLTEVDGDPAQKVYGPEEDNYVEGAVVGAFAVTYHAPTSNPGGIMSPTIQLYCSFALIFSASIAVNGYSAHDKIAYEVSYCHKPGEFWRKNVKAYWCDDELAGEMDVGSFLT